MLPHKTKRGAAALGRLRICEGIPAPYDKRKRVCVPSALRVIRMNPRRKFTVLGDLSHEVGWKYQEVIDTLETKRKLKASKYYARKKEGIKLRSKAKESEAVKKQLAPLQSIIESYGYT